MVCVTYKSGDNPRVPLRVDRRSVEKRKVLYDCM